MLRMLAAVAILAAFTGIALALEAANLIPAPY